MAAKKDVQLVARDAGRPLEAAAGPNGGEHRIAALLVEVRDALSGVAVHLGDLASRATHAGDEASAAREEFRRALEASERGTRAILGERIASLDERAATLGSRIEDAATSASTEIRTGLASVAHEVARAGTSVSGRLDAIESRYEERNEIFMEAVALIERRLEAVEGIVGATATTASGLRALEESMTRLREGQEGQASSLGAELQDVRSTVDETVRQVLERMQGFEAGIVKLLEILLKRRAPGP